MDIRDIRLGNYYLYEGEIIQMDNETLSDMLRCGGESAYQGVSITEDKLIQLGFIRIPAKHRGDTYKLGDFEIIAPTENGYGFIYEATRIPLRYIHQIQDLSNILQNEELILQANKQAEE